MPAPSRFPLQWPTTWPRTLNTNRKRASFFGITSSPTTMGDGAVVYSKSRRPVTIAEALERLDNELRRLGAVDALLSSNLRLQLSGAPVSKQAEPADPGVAIYFVLQGDERVLAVDCWDRCADNIAALAGHIDAMRAQERYGVGNLKMAFSAYALPPHVYGKPWREVLGFDATWPRALGKRVETAELEAIVKTAFRTRAREIHPDTTSGDGGMADLLKARDEAIVEIQNR